MMTLSSEQVRLSALDGRRMAHFPELQQVIAEACNAGHVAAGTWPEASMISEAQVSFRADAGSPDLLPNDAPEEDGCLAIEYPPGEVHEVDEYEEAAGMPCARSKPCMP